MAVMVTSQGSIVARAIIQNGFIQNSYSTK